MKRIIGIVLFCFIITSVCYAKDFIILTQLKSQRIDKNSKWFEPIKYEYMKVKIMIKKVLILGASVTFFEHGMQVTEIHKKGENIYVVESPEEVYKLLEEVGK